MKSNPIAVFDSGMGGLTVLDELVKLLPHENMVYYSDTANCPYGPRSQQEVIALVKSAVDFLIAQQAKIVVIACNTATAAAIETLRQEYTLPFIGMEPAVKPAALNTKTGVVGILATQGTFQGKLFHRSYQKYSNTTKIITQIGEGLVELVEQNREQSPEAIALVEQYVEPMLAQGADNIVLGCTHYPFLTRQIQQVIGAREVNIINPAPAVARHTKDVLVTLNLLNDSPEVPYHRFFSSGNEAYTAQLEKKWQSL